MNPYMPYTSYMPQDAYMQDQMALRQRIDNLSQAQQHYRHRTCRHRWHSVAVTLKKAS